MLRPLNDYYVIRWFDEEKKQGMFILPSDPKGEQIRLGTIIGTPDDNVLNLALHDLVYVHQHYTHEMPSRCEGTALVKKEYILAEYKDK